jgi:hypothetical protein
MAMQPRCACPGHIGGIVIDQQRLLRWNADARQATTIRLAQPELGRDIGLISHQRGNLGIQGREMLPDQQLVVGQQALTTSGCSRGSNAVVATIGVTATF